MENKLLSVVCIDLKIRFIFTVKSNIWIVIESLIKFVELKYIAIAHLYMNMCSENEFYP